MCSATGGPGSDPGRAPTHCFSGHAEATSHIQQLEGCATMTYNYLLGLWGKKKGGGLTTDVSSAPVFLSKKRRISMDVSSRLIFLTHTQKKNKDIFRPDGIFKKCVSIDSFSGSTCATSMGHKPKEKIQTTGNRGFSPNGISRVMVKGDPRMAAVSSFSLKQFRRLQQRFLQEN